MFNFNLYSSLLLVGFVPGVLYALLLGIRAYREERWSDVFASLVLLIGCGFVAQWMLGFGGWYDDRDWRTTLMFYVRWDHLLLLGPALYFYLQSVTNTDWRWRWSRAKHLVPWALVTSYYLALVVYDFGYVLAWLGEPFTYFDGSRGPAMEYEHQGGPIPAGWAVVAIRLHLLAYLLVGIGYYRRYQTYLRSGFSNVADLQLRGLATLMYGLFLGLLLFLALEVYQQFSGPGTYISAWPQYFLMSVLVFGAGIQFLLLDGRTTRQLRFTDELQPTSPPPPDPSPTRAYNSPTKIAGASLGNATVPASAGDDPELERWETKLESYLAHERPYLNPELKLATLAEAIGTNASVLSRVINRRYGQNFNDFINGRRCAAFLEKIAAGEHQRHTLLSLALDAGFNSKSTFNRAFRKQYGYAPGEAIKRLDRPAKQGADHDLTRAKP